MASSEKKSAGAVGNAPASAVHNWSRKKAIVKLETALGAIDPRGVNAEALRLTIEAILLELQPTVVEPGEE